MATYTTTFWEEGFEWNGVIYPLEMQDLRKTKRDTGAEELIINDINHDGYEDEIRCAVELMVKKAKTAMADAIRLIDEVRKVDVPIMLYVFLYVLGLLLAFGLAYLMLGIIRLYVTLAVVLVVFLVLGITFAMSLITFVSFEEEEQEDARSLATLYNHIKRQRVQQMNYVRMDLKIKSLGESRS